MPEQLYEYNDLEVFATGTWHGDEYTTKDLDDMVDSFGKENLGFVPFVKLGHDKKQKFAGGLPRVGDIVSIRRSGNKLLASLKNLPEKVYNAIKRRNYNNVSSEVYWNYENNGKKFRRVLKAIALLGQDIPEVNNLEDLEALYHSSGENFEKLFCYSFKIGEASNSDIVAHGATVINFALPDKFSDKPWTDINKAELPMSAFLYVGDPDRKATWKLPVYEGAGAVDSDTGMYRERGKLNINGVKAAYAAMMGARGGVDLPQDVRAGIISKLEKWLTEAGIGGRGEEDMSKDNDKHEEEKEMSDKKTEEKVDKSLELELKVAELSKKLEDAKSATEQKDSKISELSSNVEELTKAKDALTKKTEEFSKKEIEFSTLSKQVEVLSATVEAQRIANQELAEEKRKSSNEIWIKEHSSEGANFCILPAEKETVSLILDNLTSGQEGLKEFSIGEGKKTNLVSLFKEYVESRNQSALLREHAKNLPPKTDYEDAGVEVNRRVQEFMKENKEMGYTSALESVLKADPELKKAYYSRK